MDLTGKGGFAYLNNMYIDYGGTGGAVESIVGYRKIRGMPSRISAISQIGEKEDASLIIHCKKSVYLAPISQRDEGLPLKRVAEMEDENRLFFPMDNICLLSDGNKIISVDFKGKVKIISEDKELAGCRCATLYDGRVFLSGNPKLPGCVFYSSPCENQSPSFEKKLIREVDQKNTLSLCSLGGSLWVIHDGGIAVYSPCESQDALYRRVKVIDGFTPISGGIILGGELIFMTSEGLLSICLTESDKEIRINNISKKINGFLLRENMKNIFLSVWMGYILMGIGERIYLADRRGGDGVDWYPLSGIGGYKGDNRVYRYREVNGSAIRSHPIPHQVARGEIYSRGEPDGAFSYYSVEEDMHYEVYPTEEFSGGEFIPASIIHSDGELMWFAAEDTLYLFNSDKRGVLPHGSQENNSEQICPSDITIHPIFYSFAGHRRDCTAITHPIDRTQSKAATSIRLKQMARATIRLTEYLDGISVREREINTKSPLLSSDCVIKSHIRSADFTTITLLKGCRNKGWLQICLSSDGYASPFGIERITPYSYSK